MAPELAGGRVSWLDLARASSIILVVVYHITVGAGADLLGQGVVGKIWEQAGIALVPLRMPLFFAVSGVLAFRAIHRPLRAVLRPRIFDMLWPYVLWSLVFAVTAWPRYAPDSAAAFVRGEVMGMVTFASPYWFIAVLPVFFLAARLGRNHPQILLVLAVLAYFIAPFVDRAMRNSAMSGDQAYGVFQLLDNALWFILGFVARGAVLALGSKSRAVPGMLLLVMFVALAVAIPVVDVPLAARRTLELLASFSGLLSCVSVLPLLGSFERVARLGNRLGRATLVIYLVHPLVINGVVVLWRVAGVETHVGELVRAVVVVPVLTAISVLVALLVDATVARYGPQWVFKAPGGEGKEGSRGALRAAS